jgi:hypothetical protein
LWLRRVGVVELVYRMKIQLIFTRDQLQRLPSRLVRTTVGYKKANKLRTPVFYPVILAKNDLFVRYMSDDQQLTTTKRGSAQPQPQPAKRQRQATNEPGSRCKLSTRPYLLHNH